MKSLNTFRMLTAATSLFTLFIITCIVLNLIFSILNDTIWHDQTIKLITAITTSVHLALAIGSLVLQGWLYIRMGKDFYEN